MTPADVGAGIVTGGWAHVAAAYALSWIVLVGYSVSLWLRTPRGGEP